MMEYTGGGEHFKARENIIVQRPASMRVEVMSPLGVALVVAADGGQIAVFDPGKNTLMQGAANAATLERFARIPMAPHAAVRLLLGACPRQRDARICRPNRDRQWRRARCSLLLSRAGRGDHELDLTANDNLEMVRETLAERPCELRSTLQ